MNSWLLELWSEAVNPYMQSMHFCYSLGSTLGPLIVRPFLSKVHKNDTHVNATATEFESDEGDGDAATSRIIIPFAISATLYLIAAAIQIVLFLKIKYKQSERGVSSGAGSVESETQMNGSLKRSSDTSHLLSEETNPLPKSYFISVVVIGAFLLCFEGKQNDGASKLCNLFAFQVAWNKTRTTTCRASPSTRS